MIALTAQEQELVSRFQSLSPQRKRQVLLEMARGDADGWKRFHRDGEERLRQLARHAGQDWDRMDDEARQAFVERLSDDKAT